MAIHFTDNGVLLVEDDADDQALIRIAFESARIQQPLTIVSNGRQAIKYLSGEEPYCDRLAFPLPRLILLDLHMPYVNGFEVLRWVRARPELRLMPITVLSGSEYPRDLDLAYELGANSFLSKPVSLEKLSCTIKTATDFWLDCCKLPTLGGGSKGRCFVL